MGIKIVFSPIEALVDIEGPNGAGIAFRLSGPNIQHGDSLR